MRHLPHTVVVLMAAAIGTGATAGAANPNPPKPPLRTSAAGAALPAVVVQKPILRASSATMPAAKPVVAKVVVKPVPHKIVVAVKHRPARAQILRRGSPTIGVPLDEVRVVAFSKPVSTIYVGNPMIADVSMIDNKHAFVLGKSFGNTNVVALDANGKQVVNDPVNVFGHTGSTVVLHRGTQQTTYACAGARCESAPTPGDDKDYSTRMEQVATHQDAGVKAASVSH